MVLYWPPIPMPTSSDSAPLPTFAACVGRSLMIGGLAATSVEVQPQARKYLNGHGGVYVILPDAAQDAAEPALDHRDRRLSRERQR